MPYTIRSIEAANKLSGMHFFDGDAKRFFSSRILGPVFEGPGGVYFVTSEQFRSFGGSDFIPRRYSVRRFDPHTGSVETAGTFQAHKSALQAKRHARDYASGAATPNRSAS
jgi:hypothetical protein